MIVDHLSGCTSGFRRVPLAMSQAFVEFLRVQVVSLPLQLSWYPKCLVLSSSCSRDPSWLKVHLFLIQKRTCLMINVLSLTVYLLFGSISEGLQLSDPAPASTAGSAAGSFPAVADFGGRAEATWRQNLAPLMGGPNGRA